MTVKLALPPPLRYTKGMSVVQNVAEITWPACVLAVGNFDGVHAGHQKLLAQAQTVAQTEKLPLVVLTFEPHPRTVFNPQNPVQRLTTEDEKAVLLQAEGVDHIFIQDFTLDFAATTPQAFIDFMVKGLRAQHIVVGENFRFGAKAEGDVALLNAQTHFTTHAITLLEDDDGVVSSTRLRIKQ